MKKRFASILVLSACVIALCAGVLAGCTNPTGSQSNTEQQQNRAYMSQVNEIIIEANGRLDAFVSAVSDGDIVNIKATANEAMRTLSKLSSLEAPDALKDIQKDYVDGSEKLSEALTQYVDLFSNMQSDTADQAVTKEALTQIQDLYDEGVSLLKSADEAAAEL